jgi:hypothetical protein
MANAVASAKKMTTTSPSRDIAFPLGPIHFVRCACLFASENSELTAKKIPIGAGLSAGHVLDERQQRSGEDFFGTHRCAAQDSAPAVMALS